MAESLPLETLQHIFSYLLDHLTPCACVCKQWQVAAEKFNFADLRINLADLEDFRQIFLSSHSRHRWFYVKSLNYKIVIPEYSVADRGHYENQDDCDRNNKVFTQAMLSLFEILSLLPSHDRKAISLKIYARSPSDWQGEPDWDTRRARQQRGYAFPEEELLDRRYQDSYLRLTGNVSLSNVYCVTSFQVIGCDSFRNVAPETLSEMVAHLPQLQNLHASLRKQYSMNAASCEIFERDFSTTMWPLSLKHLQLSYMPNRVYREVCSLLSNQGPDSVCLAMHQLTQQLETVHLSEIMISSELFWPADASTTPPFWPKLIKFNISCAYASTYATSPVSVTPRLDEDSSSVSSDDSVRSLDDQNQNQKGCVFHKLLIKRLDELYIAAGRAAQHMPRLNSMAIDVGTARVPKSLYLFTYSASLGVATWETPNEFCVSNEVQTAWDAAAKGHGHGQICTEVRSYSST